MPVRAYAEPIHANHWSWTCLTSGDGKTALCGEKKGGICVMGFNQYSKLRFVLKQKDLRCRRQQ